MSAENRDRSVWIAHRRKPIPFPVRAVRLAGETAAGKKHPRPGWYFQLSPVLAVQEPCALGPKSGCVGVAQVEREDLGLLKVAESHLMKTIVGNTKRRAGSMNDDRAGPRGIDPVKTGLYDP